MKKNVLVNFKPRSIVLLHGSFVTAFYVSLAKRKVRNVFVLEGRPHFDSSREACRQLLKRHITPTVIADNTAGFLFARNLVKGVWVAYQTADRQEILCDAGGLVLGVLAKVHRVPLYAFPGVKKSHFVGNPDDICRLEGARTAPQGVKGYVPLIDILPKKYVRRVYGRT